MWSVYIATAAAVYHVVYHVVYITRVHTDKHGLVTMVVGLRLMAILTSSHYETRMLNLVGRSTVTSFSCQAETSYDSMMKSLTLIPFTVT